MFDKLELERIFFDAHIIDIDLGDWGNQIEMWVLSDRYVGCESRIPLLRFRFKSINLFKIECQHSRPTLEDDRRYQWFVSELELDHVKSGYKFNFIGGGASPLLTIESDTVEWEEVDHSLLDKLHDGWDSPFSGFVRASMVGIKYRIYQP